MWSAIRPVLGRNTAMRRRWHCGGSFSAQSGHTGLGTETRRSRMSLRRPRASGDDAAPSSGDQRGPPGAGALRSIGNSPLSGKPLLSLMDRLPAVPEPRSTYGRRYAWGCWCSALPPVGCVPETKGPSAAKGNVVMSPTGGQQLPLPTAARQDPPQSGLGLTSLESGSAQR